MSVDRHVTGKSPVSSVSLPCEVPGGARSVSSDSPLSSSASHVSPRSLIEDEIKSASDSPLSPSSPSLSSSGSVEEKEEKKTSQEESKKTEVIVRFHYWPGKLISATHFGHVSFEAIVDTKSYYLSFGRVNSPTTFFGDSICYGWRSGGRERISYDFRCSLTSEAEVEELCKKLNKGWDRPDYHPLSKNCAHFAIANSIQLLSIKGQEEKFTSLQTEKGLRPHVVAEQICSLKLKSIADERQQILSNETKIDARTCVMRLLLNDIERLKIKKDIRYISFFQRKVTKKAMKILKLTELNKLLSNDSQTDIFVKEFKAACSDKNLGKKTRAKLLECGPFVALLKVQAEKVLTP